MTKLNWSALVVPLGPPLKFAKSKVKVPNWLTFWLVLNWLKLSPVYVLPPAIMVIGPKLPALRLAVVLNPTCPPCNLMVKPGFMVIVTNTEPPPLSVNVTVPTEPDTPMLFEVKEMESATANGVHSASKRAAESNVRWMRETGRDIGRPRSFQKPCTFRCNLGPAPAGILKIL